MQAEGEDSLKKMQLMELAILNGTYRDANIKSRKSGRPAPAVPARRPPTALRAASQPAGGWRDRTKRLSLDAGLAAPFRLQSQIEDTLLILFYASML